MSKLMAAEASLAERADAAALAGMALQPPFNATDDGASSAHSADRRRVVLVARALEADVIPRLVLSRGDDLAQSRPGRDGEVLQQEDMAALSRIVMAGDLAGANAYVAALRARGVSLPRIYIDLLAPTARHLGDLWLEDRCDFASVTAGLCCLQQVVLANSNEFGPRQRRPQGGQERRILLAPTPGEQHTFGLVLVGEFFRRQGWEVVSATGADAKEIVALAKRHWFGMVGFTMAGEERLELLARLIRDVRHTTRNPRLGVLVGGQTFLERPELVALAGADAMATDGEQAVLKAETLLALMLEDA
jgi:methanogenic corrinoid protein MtbC1